MEGFWRNFQIWCILLGEASAVIGKSDVAGFLPLKSLIYLYLRKFGEYTEPKPRICVYVNSSKKNGPLNNILAKTTIFGGSSLNF